MKPSVQRHCPSSALHTPRPLQSEGLGRENQGGGWLGRRRGRGEKEEEEEEEEQEEEEEVKTQA